MTSLAQELETVNQARVGSNAIPACTCPVSGAIPDSLCPACFEELMEWARSRPFPDPEPMEDEDGPEDARECLGDGPGEPWDAFPDAYHDEPDTLPEGVYHGSQRIRIGTMAELLQGEVPASALAGFRFSDVIYVEVKEGEEIVEFRPFLDRVLARTYAASLFGEGGYEDMDLSPEEIAMHAGTVSAFDYWQTELDPTGGIEDDEAMARSFMEHGR